MRVAEVKYGLAGMVADDTAVSKVMPEINSFSRSKTPIYCAIYSRRIIRLRVRITRAALSQISARATT